jgi:hypothetical protein
MAKANVAQSEAVTIKSSITEIDMTVQTAQKEGEALVAGIQALIRAQDGIHTANLRNAEALCERLDSVLFSLMNDVNCMAERHDAHYMEAVHV